MEERSDSTRITSLARSAGEAERSCLKFCAVVSFMFGCFFLDVEEDTLICLLFYACFVRKSVINGDGDRGRSLISRTSDVVVVKLIVIARVWYCV